MTSPALTSPDLRIDSPNGETDHEHGVSVLLPAYNAERFVDETVASVRAQTFADWEIVAVDDSSTDGTYERLQGWAEREPRLRLYRNDINLGMSGNWNRSLALARRPLVLKLDADDVLRPRTLELLTAALAEPTVVGAGVRTLLCAENLDPIDGLPADDAMQNAGIDPYMDQLLPCSRLILLAFHGHQLWHSCALMLRRQWLVASGGYDAHFGCATDTELVMRALTRAGVFAHKAYVGVLYRRVAGSVSHQFRSHDWLTWESTVIRLLGMSRYRQRHALPHSLRHWYVELWQRWRSHAASEDFERTLTPQLRTGLTEAMREVGPPPLQDRLFWKARRVASRLAP